jgi:glycosyltransferase involved in cell wall biosynthesis
MHHRPVICSGVGGMAEKVTEGVDGLHFRIGDAKDLAAVMKRVARSPEEWRRLRSGIAPVYSMEESVEAHREIYGGLLASRGRMHAESSA